MHIPYLIHFNIIYYLDIILILILRFDYNDLHKIIISSFQHLVGSLQ